MDPISRPTVCLDGNAVRRIREEKKLTQLYVAKVVGVTTDTISRWENNRYPSVKRENGDRLAEALEVSLEAILQQEISCDERAAGRSRKRHLPLAFALLCLGIAAIIFSFRSFFPSPPAPQVGVHVERVLPHFAAPGSVIPVRVRLEVEEGVKGFILREHFPAGWKLIEANPPASSVDNEEGMVRWIIRPGRSPGIISYLIRVGPGAETGAIRKFFGDVVANPDGRNAPVPISGETGIRTAAYLWADQNGDGVVDDSEMLQASDTMDEMKGVHLDWNLLEEIWDAGSYRWDESRQRFLPFRPPSEEAVATKAE